MTTKIHAKVYIDDRQDPIDMVEFNQHDYIQGLKDIAQFGKIVKIEPGKMVWYPPHRITEITLVSYE